jgi:HlyD family secretion protein
MLIVPEEDELVIEARVRPQDIDQVYKGQAATLRFRQRGCTIDAPDEW